MMAVCLLSRIVLQPLSNYLPIVTNFYPICRQLLVSKPVSGYQTPLVLIQTKATGSKGSRVEEELSFEEINPEVQVFDEAGSFISLMKKDKAIKLAKSKELKLVEINETKNSKQPLCYQLMTGKQLHENQQKERQLKKEKNQKSEEKVLNLKGNISDHDLGIKLNKMKNLLEKDFDIRISIKSFSSNEENNRKQQSVLFKKITEEVMNIATVKKASSTDREIILLIRNVSKN